MRENNIIKRKNYALIELWSRKRKTKYHAKIDLDDIERIKSSRWSVGSKNTVRSTTKPQTFLHRLIMGVNNPKILIDHIDRNTLDNRKSNLRIATTSQNAANSKSRKGSSIFKGVFWRKD